METDPASASCNPVWNATLGFGGLTADLLAGRAIELTLWDACPGIDPLLIGECTVSNDIQFIFASSLCVFFINDVLEINHLVNYTNSTA